MKKSHLMLGLGVLAAVAVGGGLLRKVRNGSSSEPARARIAVIPKGTTHDFWNAVRSGAQRAAEEEGIEIFWNGPEREGDRERQIQIVEDFIVRRVTALVLAPSDARALVPVVERAAEGRSSGRHHRFRHRDHSPGVLRGDRQLPGGVLAARHLADRLERRGRVAVIKYMAGSASTTARENGFLETMARDFPDIEVVEARYGQDTVETALSAAEDVLTRHQELNGLFACNESTARGTLRALESQGRTGITLVGFDSSEPLLEGLRAGRISALVVQNPFRMGYDGVRTALAAAAGDPVPERIDTGVELVTAENMDQPAIRQLLHPEG